MGILQWPWLLFFCWNGILHLFLTWNKYFHHCKNSAPHPKIPSHKSNVAIYYTLWFAEYTSINIIRPRRKPNQIGRILSKKILDLNEFEHFWKFDCSELYPVLELDYQGASDPFLTLPWTILEVHFQIWGQFCATDMLSLSLPLKL